MELTLTEEHEQLAEATRDFLEQAQPLTRVREVSESADAFDRDVWTRMAAELDLQSLSIPEEYGGAGFTYSESALVIAALGRTLDPGPFLASAVIAAHTVLSAGDDDANARLLPGIAAGSTIATVGIFEEAAGLAIDTRASINGSTATITGTKRYVLAGGIADVFLIFASSDAGLTLVEVAADAQGVGVQTESTLDRTRPLSTVRFDRAEGRVIGTAGSAASVLTHSLTIARAGLAEEQTAAARECLYRTVEYVKIREQFGRKIGSFQAVKHRLADVLVAVEGASSAVTLARSAIAENSASAEIAGLVAAATCSEAFLFSAQQMVQLHGGIGFTWEHDAHLYLRRAKSSHALFGAPHEAREALAVVLDL